LPRRERISRSDIPARRSRAVIAVTLEASVASSAGRRETQSRRAVRYPLI
jgi:hypothetical protein